MVILDRVEFPGDSKREGRGWEWVDYFRGGSWERLLRGGPWKRVFNEKEPHTSRFEGRDTQAEGTARAQALVYSRVLGTSWARENVATVKSKVLRSLFCATLETRIKYLDFIPRDGKPLVGFLQMGNTVWFPFQCRYSGRGEDYRRAVRAAGRQVQGEMLSPGAKWTAGVSEVHDARRGLETERRMEENDRGAAFLRKLATAPWGPVLDISFSPVTFPLTPVVCCWGSSSPWGKTALPKRLGWGVRLQVWLQEGVNLEVVWAKKGRRQPQQSLFSGMNCYFAFSVFVCFFFNSIYMGPT